MVALPDMISAMVFNLLQLEAFFRSIPLNRLSETLVKDNPTPSLLDWRKDLQTCLPRDLFTCVCRFQKPTRVSMIMVAGASSL